MDVLRRRKRHKSETNCKRCRLSASAFSNPVCVRSIFSTDDCIPTPVEVLLASRLSTVARTSPIGSCDECPPTFQFRNPLYSSCNIPSPSSSCPSAFSHFSCSTCSSSSFSSRSSSISHSSSTPVEKSNLRLSISSSSDDDMNASSPDSGFESTSSNGSSMVDYFANLKSDDSLDDSSKSSSPSTPPPRLCLKPPPKSKLPISAKEIEPAISCQWKNCGLLFSNYSNLHEHLCCTHVESTDKRICCLWENCRVYNKEARNLEWLQTHVGTHAMRKRFKCILDGCEASFSSQFGLARHVPSHFNEVNLPKARISGNTERKCLVKRRKIKDKKKALANIHDLMDEHSLDLIGNSLVKHTQASASNPDMENEKQILCKRYCKDGTTWRLLHSEQKWLGGPSGPSHDGVLFFAKPTKRCRKLKVMK